MAAPNPGLNTHHEILIADAASMQNRFIESGELNTQHTGGFFFRQGIDAILAQANCIGLRYYYTYDGGILKVIMLGVENRSYYDLFNGFIIGNAETEPDDCTDIPEVTQQLSLGDGISATGAFRTQYPELIIGGFFFRSIIDYFIDLDDVIGLRYKFGINESGELKLILNPVDSGFCDMVVYNAGGEQIKAETSGGGGDGNPANPLIPH